MRKNLLLNVIVTAFAILIAGNIDAQEETNIILDPATLTPADTGYYIGGVEKDKNGDLIDEFYNGCEDEYGDSEHRESGKQQGFTYNKCMIMPTCWPKDLINDSTKAVTDYAKGYIQLTKTKYIGTDSASMGYIITPSLKNLVSMDLVISPDVTPATKKHIYYWIEYSKDNGVTWEDTKIVDEFLNEDKKYDELHVYNNTITEFQEMISASEQGAIVLRIMTKPQIQIGETIDYYAQRLKVHYIHIKGEYGNSINNTYMEIPIVKVFDNIISCEDSEITVFNTLGQYMGSGNYISVNQGIYIVQFENGLTQKILVH
jgi:ASC-1-like (ASCH) protein